jgi:hypothetical protein
MKTQKERDSQLDVESKNEQTTPKFNQDEWAFITQCVAEATIKAKDAATVANILSKLKENCK